MVLNMEPVSSKGETDLCILENGKIIFARVLLFAFCNAFLTDMSFLIRKR